MLRDEVVKTNHDQYTKNKCEFMIKSSNLYEKFTDNEFNRKVTMQNLIFPNFKLLNKDPLYKEILVNGYRKLYYDDKPLNILSDYNAFYPENFYYLWEILSDYNIITEKNNRFVFLDDGGNTPLGHIESTIKYCENNFRYEHNEYIRIPLNKTKVNPIDKKFVSIYNNHSMYSFTTHDGIVKYFSDKKFNCAIGICKNLQQNLVCLSLCDKGANVILYIDNFFDTDVKIINDVVKSFEKIYIVQSQLQDKLDTSCNLVLINYMDNDKEACTSNINKIKLMYYNKYINNLLDLYHKSCITDLEISKQTFSEQTKLLEKYSMLSDTNNINIQPQYYNFILKKYISESINKSYETQINKLHYNKRKLNKYKRILDTKEQFVENDIERDIIDWNKLTNSIDVYKNLKRIIGWKFNAESVNNTWLKFYEILSHENLLQNIVDELKTFHVQETNGASIFALNHYIATKTKLQYFTWYAGCSNYHEEFCGRYDLQDIFPDNWIDYGSYMSDTRLQNIDLIICDGSVKIPPDKFNEQEAYTFKIIQEQIDIAMKLLKKGNMLIIKLFIPFAEINTINLLYKLTCCFETVNIIKPCTSHASSSEVYSICKGYISNKYNENYDNIPSEFMDEIIKISNELSDRQILSIKRSLYLRREYYTNYELQNEVTIQKELCVNKWLSENILDKLQDKHKMIG